MTSKDKEIFKFYMNDTKYTAKDFIRRSCNEQSHDRGKIETLEYNVETTIEVTSRLVDLLFERGMITEKDVYFIGRGYE